MNFNLAGKTVLVCGGSSGIGFAIAKSLAKHDGTKVVLASSNIEKLQNAISELNAPSMHKIYQIDLRVREQVEELITYLADNGIAVDIQLTISLASNVLEEMDDWTSATQGNFKSRPAYKILSLNMQSKG